MDPLDGHQLHPTLLQPVGEHGPEDRRRGGQHHLVRHEIHRVQVLVAHAQGDVAQLPLQPQLVHDGEGGRRVALERVAEDAVAVARGRSDQRFALCQALCHFPPDLLLLLLPLPPPHWLSGTVGNIIGHGCTRHRRGGNWWLGRLLEASLSLGAGQSV